MSFWWVNQGRTWLHEVEGNYLWAPRRNSAGQTFVHWTNMQRLRVGDVVFSYHKGAIRAVGEVTAAAIESPRPDFGSANSLWESDGWEVLVNWVKLTAPINPREYLEILNADRGKHMPMNVSGQVNMGYLYEVSSDFGQAIYANCYTDSLPQVAAAEDAETRQLIEETQELLGDSTRTRTERTQLVAARLGQGMFKDRVARLEPACRVTGVANPRHLIASHMKPWRSSNNEERLSGANGLLLSPHIDHLFDRGLITFLNSGKLVTSPQLSDDVASRLNVHQQQVVRSFAKKQVAFIEYHRDVIFKTEVA